MEKWIGLEAIRKYVWNYLLYRNREGAKISFNETYDMIKSYIYQALDSNLLNTHNVSRKEHCRIARREMELHDTEIKELIEELVLKMGKKQAKDNINRITARAILRPILDRAGFKYYIEYPKTGVKINVQFLPKKKAQLYMSYSKVHKESDKLVNNILSIKQIYTYFGHNSGIVNISMDEEELFNKE